MNTMDTFLLTRTKIHDTKVPNNRPRPPKSSHCNVERSNTLDTATAIPVKYTYRIVCFFRLIPSDNMKISIGMIKNNAPPHAETANAMTIPPASSFNQDWFLQVSINPSLLFLTAEMKRNNASKPRNNPNGSDLNHPAIPLTSIGTDTAKKKAQNNPALQSRNFDPIPSITAVVAPPIITGNIIANSYVVKSSRFLDALGASPNG